MQEKFSVSTLGSRIYELYQIWQNTIRDNKIKRENDILLKKINENIKKFKKSFIRYVDNYKH